MHKFFNPRRDFANVTKIQQARAQANQQAWKEIPLRDFIRDNPTMQALDPILKMRFEIESTRDYTEIEAIISEVLYNDMGAGEQAEQQLASTMKHIAKHLAENTVFTSGENHIPGFRQIVFMNLDIIPKYCDNYSRTIRMAAITDDGCLVTNILKGTNTAEKLQSTAEMLEVVLAGRTDWNIKSATEDRDLFRLYEFDFDKHSGTTCLKLDIGYNNIPFELERCGIGRFITSDRFDLHNHIKNILLENVNHNLDLARMTLCNALDPDILHDMRAGNITRLSQVMWLTGGDGADPEKTLARQQAIRAYPILANDFNELEFYRKTIDARESLSNAIAILHDVEQSRVRNIQGITRQWAACTGDWSAYEAISNILSLPNRFIPLTRKQTRQLSVLRDFQKHVFKDVLDDKFSLGEFMTRLSTEGHLWKLADRLEKYNPRDVNDAVDFLARKLFIPAALTGIRKRHDRSFKHDARLKILTSFKIRNLLDFSDRYHRNIHRWEDRLTSISFQQNWPGLLGTVELEDGHVARELCSSIDLKAQGRAENNCVGGYMSKILEGNTCGETVALIFSIEKNGTILSTVEINCAESDGLQAWVERNEGYDNASPSDTASIMAEQIVSEIILIKPDAWHVYLDGLERIRIEMDRMSAVVRFGKICGFDPNDRNMLERVWKEFRPVLPQAMRRAGLDAFIDWAGEEFREKLSWRKYNSNPDISGRKKPSDQTGDEFQLTM